MKRIRQFIAAHATLLLTYHAKLDQRVPPVQVHTRWSTEGDERSIVGVGVAGLACQDKYRGIGIRHYFGAVMFVAPGGPADKAGIQAGDVVLTEGSFALPIGTVLDIRVQRGGAVLEFKVRVDDVCFV